MKKIVTLVLAIMMVLSFAACGNKTAEKPAEPAAPSAEPAAPAAEPATPAAEAAAPAETKEYNDVTIRLCMSGTEQGVDYIASTWLAEQLKEKSGGKIKLELYASNILAGGSQAEAINMLTQGESFEMGLYSAAVLGNLDSNFLVWMLPFIFDDYKAVDAILDSTGDEWMAKKCLEYGLIDLNGMHCGLKQWTNNKKEIHSPADYVNFKMRIPGGEVSMAIWKAFGADPVSMSWSEVYTALQQGTVDGHENGWQTLYSNNIQEVQKFITVANYQYDGYWYLMNEKFWKTLNADTQELIRELTLEAARYGRKYLEDVEDGLCKEVSTNGKNVVNTLTPEEKAAFIEAAKPVLAQFYDSYGADAYKALGIAYTPAA